MLLYVYMKIQIIGPSGSGKTTLGKFISTKLGINFIDTDTYYWKDPKNMIPNTTEEREEIFLKDLNIDKNNWIVSGSIFSWNKIHLMDKDIIVYLSVNEEERIERLVNRLKENPNYGEDSEDFLAWAKNYFNETDPTKGGTYVCHMAELEFVKSNTKSKIIYLNGEDKVEDNFNKITQK